MNYRGIFRILSYIMLVEVLAFIPSGAVALYDGDYHVVKGFLYPAVILILLSIPLRLLSDKKNTQLFVREGYLIVGLTWVFMSLFGALPFYISGEIPNYIDALFESISGFTTTGASVLRDLETVSRGLILWRSFTQWLGGMGILVFTMAVIPFAKGGSGNSYHVLRAESPGPSVEKIVPKIREHSAILYIIYLVLTVICFLFLFLGGMPLFDSIVTTFGTAGTGGFSVLNDSLASYSIYSQIVVTIFMILFGVNFNIYFYLILRKFKYILKDEELRAYIGILLAAILLITLNTYKLFESIPQAVQQVSFSVGSVMTTSGYNITDYSKWPLFSRILLVMLMLVGASAGSTACGIKVSRILLLVKNCHREMRNILHPRSIKPLRLSGEVVNEKTIHNATIFTIVYVLIFFISLLLISLDNFSAETSITAVVACLSNIGPGLDQIGPRSNYADFSSLSKLILSFDMLLGRLEIFPLLILFHYRTWSRTA